MVEKNINKIQTIEKQKRKLLDADDLKLKEIKSQKWATKYQDLLNKRLEEIIETRFTSNCTKSFSDMKRLTGIDKMEKKEGGIVTKATKDGEILSGLQLEKQLLENYKNLH